MIWMLLWTWPHLSLKTCRRMMTLANILAGTLGWRSRNNVGFMLSYSVVFVVLREKLLILMGRVIGKGRRNLN